jgi:hypothetical protein
MCLAFHIADAGTCMVSEMQCRCQVLVLCGAQSYDAMPKCNPTHEFMCHVLVKPAVSSTCM